MIGLEPVQVVGSLLSAQPPHLKQQIASWKVTKMFNEAIKTLPKEWHQKNSGKKLFSRSDKTEEVVENGERKSIKKIKLDWDLFRDALANSGIEFNQKSGKMRRKELLALNNVDSEWGKIAAGLRLCDRRFEVPSQIMPREPMEQESRHTLTVPQNLI